MKAVLSIHLSAEIKSTCMLEFVEKPTCPPLSHSRVTQSSHNSFAHSSVTPLWNLEAVFILPKLTFITNTDDVVIVLCRTQTVRE